uniref:Nucleotide-diphospho-sugar transferase domain-containing protein n=1 Tax=Panagrolaimus sp. JU765 TaxID=591449 RepID=A0AC34R668_9BILA
MKNVHENVVIVAMDEESKKQISQQWPNLKILSWIIPCLKDSFNYGDGKYQLFFVFRSNLARSFLYFGKTIWMIQQDTFWRENLLETKIDKDQPKVDIIFDRASEGDSKIIAGGYYFAKPTCSSQIFFKQLSYDLERIYAPDNAYMTYLCSNKGSINCGLVPFK